MLQAPAVQEAASRDNAKTSTLSQQQASHQSQQPAPTPISVDLSSVATQQQLLQQPRQEKEMSAESNAPDISNLAQFWTNPVIPIPHPLVKAFVYLGDAEKPQDTGWTYGKRAGKLNLPSGVRLPA